MLTFGLTNSKASAPIRGKTQTMAQTTHTLASAVAQPNLSFLFLRDIYILHFDCEKTKATGDSIACEKTPPLNLQIIFCKLASSAMRCLLTSKLSSEKASRNLRTIKA